MAEKRSTRCWFCEHPLTGSLIERDAIIRSRQAHLGGPYRLLVCPSCNRENLCEKIPGSFWFASPTMKTSLLEYLFTQLLDTRPEDFLAAASWYRDNEDRRQYLFEREGDHRYSGSRWLSRFWSQPPPTTTDGTSNRDDTSTASQHDRAESSDSKKSTSDRVRRQSSPTGPRLLTPHEILGVTPTADDQEIRAAFRRLAKKWHPDKVHHLGEELQRRANAQFRRLKDAYETLLKQI